MTARDEILRQALNLSPDERAVLANQLLESLELSRDEKIDPEWAAEIQRRIAAYDRGELESISLDELAAQLQSRRKSA